MKRLLLIVCIVFGCSLCRAAGFEPLIDLGKITNEGKSGSISRTVACKNDGIISIHSNKTEKGTDFYCHVGIVDSDKKVISWGKYSKINGISTLADKAGFSFFVNNEADKIFLFYEVKEQDSDYYDYYCVYGNIDFMTKTIVWHDPESTNSRGSSYFVAKSLSSDGNRIGLFFKKTDSDTLGSIYFGFGRLDPLSKKCVWVNTKMECKADYFNVAIEGRYCVLIYTDDERKVYLQGGYIDYGWNSIYLGESTGVESMKASDGITSSIIKISSENNILILLNADSSGGSGVRRLDIVMAKLDSTQQYYYPTIGLISSPQELPYLNLQFTAAFTPDLKHGVISAYGVDSKTSFDLTATINFNDGNLFSEEQISSIQPFTSYKLSLSDDGKYCIKSGLGVNTKNQFYNQVGIVEEYGIKG